MHVHIAMTPYIKIQTLQQLYPVHGQTGNYFALQLWFRRLDISFQCPTFHLWVWGSAANTRHCTASMSLLPSLQLRHSWHTPYSVVSMLEQTHFYKTTFIGSNQRETNRTQNEKISLSHSYILNKEDTGKFEFGIDLPKCEYRIDIHLKNTSVYFMKGRTMPWTQIIKTII